MARAAQSSASKRDQVVRTAAKLFRETGYHATRMEDIAAGVGLDKGTLYHYVAGGKRQLLYEIFRESIAIAHEVLPELADDVDPTEAIERFVRHQLATIARRPNEAAVYFQELRFIGSSLSRAEVREIRAGERLIFERLVSAIERGVASRRFAPIDPIAAAHAVLGMCAWTLTWARSSRGSLEDVADTYVALVLDGLFTR